MLKDPTLNLLVLLYLNERTLGHDSTRSVVTTAREQRRPVLALRETDQRETSDDDWKSKQKAFGGMEMSEIEQHHLWTLLTASGAEFVPYYRRQGFREASYRTVLMKWFDLLSSGRPLVVPAATDLRAREAVRRRMQSLVKGTVAEFRPPVMISYATGQREGDAAGCGPGMLYAQAVTDELLRRGVDAFTGLHVGAGDDWRIFIDKLRGETTLAEDSACKVLIVIVTPALYQSRHCLEEIFTALEEGIHIIPMLFENPIPPDSQRWPMVLNELDRSHSTPDSERVEMRTRVLRRSADLFGARNVIPAPPGDVVTQPEVLKRVADDVVRRLGIEGSAAQNEPEPEPI